MGSHNVLGCQVPYTRFYEWFPLIHLLFDSIKPVGGMGRGSLVSDCVANGSEAPIFWGKPHWSGKPDGELFFGQSGACHDLTPCQTRLECFQKWWSFGGAIQTFSKPLEVKRCRFFSQKVLQQRTKTLKTPKSHPTALFTLFKNVKQFFKNLLHSQKVHFPSKP